ncbi:MAG: hypothetical protein AAFP98_01785 [Pseudomonadota bacterium]
MATSFALSASAGLAETVTCVMEDGTDLAFSIDLTQFSAPHHVNEPPRQQRTQVTYGARRFAATPFLMGAARGFEAEGLGGSTLVFVMQPNGSARLSNSQLGRAITGHCDHQRKQDQ